MSDDRSYILPDRLLDPKILSGIHKEIFDIISKSKKKLGIEELSGILTNYTLEQLDAGVSYLLCLGYLKLVNNGYRIRKTKFIK